MSDDNQLLTDLRALRALFCSPDKWTQGTFTRDAAGRDLFVRNFTGTPASFCIIGGINHVLDPAAAPFASHATHRANAVLDALEATLDVGAQSDHHDIIDWNDDPHRTFDDVADLLDLAIRERLPPGFV